MANITEAEIREVVNLVLNNMKSSTNTADWDSTHYGPRKFVGIYEDMNKIITKINR